MYSKLKVLANNFLYNFGLSVDKVTSESDISSVLDLLNVQNLDIAPIRVGSEKDGGYVIPDILADIDVCLSFGISDNCDLELQLTDLGIKVFAIDGSISELPTFNQLIEFTPKYVGRSEDKRFIDANQWIADAVRDYESVMFSMDIEEYEWEIILEIDDYLLNKVDLFVIELHGLHQLCHRSFLQKVRAALLKLSEKFVVTNVNVNNTSPMVNFKGVRTFGSVVEVTYTSKAYIERHKIAYTDRYSELRKRLNSSNR